MSYRITIDPTICHGKPCIRDLRYPVENLLEWLAAGMTIEDILSDYKDLEREDILAALSRSIRFCRSANWDYGNRNRGGRSTSKPFADDRR